MLTLPQIAVIANRRGRRGVLYDFSPNDVSLTRATIATFQDADGLVQTASAGQLRTNHWVSGVRTTLTEPARTNVVLHNRDLTNAAWIATNITAAKDQVGADGAANAASSITATAANGTILQSITLASSQRKQSARVKRLVGTGVVEMTTDNGATWTAITVTASYTRVSIPAQTLANPTVGFRIVTSGDSIAVDYVQNETGFTETSDIATTTVAVQRNADVAFVSPGQIAPPRSLTVYCRTVNVGQYIGNAALRRIVHVGTTTVSTDPKLSFGGGSGGSTQVFAEYDDAVTNRVTTAIASPSPAAIGTVVEQRVSLNADFTITVGVSVTGGAEVSNTSLASGQAAAWAANTLYLAGGLSGENTPCAYTHLLIASGVRTMAEMRNLAGV